MGRELGFGDRGGRDKWVAWLAECMEAAARVLKPGGHSAGVVAAADGRTGRRFALEDAGLEMRDCTLHLFGSGFPKSRDVLKPGQEMWWLARKPMAGRTVAANVLEFGTGALNTAACMVAHASKADQAQYDGSAGRWPTNIMFTHSATCEEDGTCAPSTR